MEHLMAEPPEEADPAAFWVAGSVEEITHEAQFP
jgi:hypothetical protein